ncbi:MAG: hypothetical protein K8T91_20425 [Planctomycetes bacterium]|nr:hypothetical protein [Planctomycetota bacterium]
MMKTITMSIDDATLSKAQQKAAALDTSISDVVSAYLRFWAEKEDAQQASQAMKERFGQANWRFAVGTPDTREQRNARS